MVENLKIEKIRSYLDLFLGVQFLLWFISLLSIIKL